jgi:SM-20-related protein
MTPKQILDSFSETLMQDERILSVQERALLAALLQHAKASTTGDRAMQEAVRGVIASAVGETVAQRAFAVLGGSIVERIVEGGPGGAGEARGQGSDPYLGPKTQPELLVPMRASGTPGHPQPPGMTPPTPQPQPPGMDPLSTPPTPSHPQPPGQGLRTTEVSKTGVGVADLPAALPAKCVILDEFLAPQELEELLHFSLQHEADFFASEVISPTAGGGIVNHEHRRSRVLTNLSRHEGVILERIKAVLPQVLRTLGMEEFAIAGSEAQVTASNDGDFFRFHNDNGSDPVASRHLTFVYFFHREPRPFEGGELRIHDARLEDGHYVSEGSYQTIVPRQNQIVFFPCELLHEITPVNCPSGQFSDSRFTLNGWLRR